MTVLREVAPEITLTPEDQLALFQCMQMAPFDVLEASSHTRTEAGRLLGDHVVAQRASVQDAWRILSGIQCIFGCGAWRGNSGL